MIQSIVHRFPLLSPIFRVAYESRVEKTDHLLRLSTNRSNFLLLHKTGSAGQPGRVDRKSDRVIESEGATSEEYDGWGRTSHFNVSKYVLTNMGSSIVNFIMSLVVLWPFVFQCSVQTHQLRSIPITCDCFSRF